MAKRGKNRKRLALQGAAYAEVLRRDGAGLSLRLGSLPEPAKEFEADIAWVAGEGAIAQLLFDQVRFAPGLEIRNRVEVRMAAESFLTFADSLEDKDFAEPFRSWLGSNAGLDALPSRKKLEGLTAETHAVLRAQLARVGHVGSDAEILFFGMSAVYLSLAIRNPAVDHIPISPIVRITMSTHVLGQLADGCAQHAAKLRPLLAEKGPA